MDVVEFLRARLDEDGRWGGEASVFDSTEDALHIARHDPTRVLRDVEAKRRRLAGHEPEGPFGTATAEGPWWRCVSPTHRALYEARAEAIDDDVWPCTVVRWETYPYADHPDYDPAWKV